MQQTRHLQHSKIVEVGQPSTRTQLQQHQVPQVICLSTQVQPQIAKQTKQGIGQQQQQIGKSNKRKDLEQHILAVQESVCVLEDEGVQQEKKATREMIGSSKDKGTDEGKKKKKKAASKNTKKTRITKMHPKRMMKMYRK